MDLCECEPAQGDPFSLTCLKEGWFLSSFERQGQWVAGGGYVPLSPAICCRPCLPVPGNGNGEDLLLVLEAAAGGRWPHEVGRLSAYETLRRAYASAHGSSGEGEERWEREDEGAEQAGPSRSLPRRAGFAPLRSLSGAAPSNNSSLPHALGLVSMACHTSSEAIPLSCEARGPSFATGFAEALAVWGSSSAHYPLDAMQCCTPALLLPSGALWPLQRCDCDAGGGAGVRREGEPEPRASEVSCGGEVSGGRLLWGFSQFRLTPGTSLVPVGPPQCCRACLAPEPSPPAPPACEDLSRCSGHGVCVRGACSCAWGWGGADCSRVLGRSGAGLPPWALALIVLSSLLLAAVLSLALGTAVRTYSAAAERAGPGGVAPGGAEAGLRVPLLPGLDPEDQGSVGSRDTDSDEEDADAIGARCEELGLGAREEGELEREEAREAEGGATEEGRTEESGGEEGSDQAVALPRPSPPSTAPPRPSAQPPAPSAPAPEPEPLKPAPGTPAAEAARAAEKESLLAGVDCVICMGRSVQVVLVPCGHLCTCRRCARRLARCPMCRAAIARRQRLFMG